MTPQQLAVHIAGRHTLIARRLDYLNDPIFAGKFRAIEGPSRPRVLAHPPDGSGVAAAGSCEPRMPAFVCDLPVLARGDSGDYSATFLAPETIRLTR
jgi:hypothetical protein